MKPSWVAALPFVVSLACSAATTGSHVGWQDSGYFLCSVHETAILYPTGFVLYLLLCKAWTLLLFFVDFTVAVSLFSSLCAALSSGVIATAARDLIRARGPLFRTGDAEPDPLVDAAAAATGVLAATGYTFWATALLTKGYAFYYLLLSLLLWRMIRAHESGRPRDFTIVAALIGLAWQGHPSAALTGLGLLAFVGVHAKLLGWKGVAWRFGLAAACAVGPMLLLPVLASRPSIVAFGEPRTAADFAEYLVGGRYTTRPGVFGVDAGRVRSAGLFLWEEMLGVGLLAVAAGLIRAARHGRRLLAGLLLWIAPVLGVTVLFKTEVQHDCWFLAAWIPLWLVAGVGLHQLGTLAGPRGRAVVAGLALLGAGWAVAVNGPLLQQRGYTLAEAMGHLYLDPVEPGSVVIVRSDDVAGPALWLHVVKGHRPDVAVVRGTHLGEDWYTRALQARYPWLAVPDYAAFRRLHPKHDQVSACSMAFANANCSLDRGVYFEVPPPTELAGTDLALTPAGPMMQLRPKCSAAMDARFWKAPVEPEDLPALCRRERGQFIEYVPDGVRIGPEAYERRLMRELLRARKFLAEWHGRAADPDRLRRAVELYESILQLDPRSRDDVSVVLPLGVALLRLKQPGRAEPRLRAAVALDLPPALRALATVALVDACRDSGKTREAEEWKARALALPELTDEQRRRLGP